MHDEARLLYNDVETDTRLKPVEEQVLNPGDILTDGAICYVRILGLSLDFQNTHLDIKVINVQAETHLTRNPNYTKTVGKCRQRIRSRHQDKMV